MLELNTRDFVEGVHVKIDGHEYFVRRLGAGEEIRISSIIREMQRIIKKLKANPSDEEAQKYDDRIDELQEEVINMTAAAFDDGGDGSKSQALIRRYTIEDRNKLINRIFASVRPKQEATGKEADSKEEATEPKPTDTAQ